MRGRVNVGGKTKINGLYPVWEKMGLCSKTMSTGTNRKRSIDIRHGKIAMIQGQTGSTLISLNAKTGEFQGRISGVTYSFDAETDWVQILSPDYVVVIKTNGTAHFFDIAEGNPVSIFTITSVKDVAYSNGYFYCMTTTNRLYKYDTNGLEIKNVSITTRDYLFTIEGYIYVYGGTVTYKYDDSLNKISENLSLPHGTYNTIKPVTYNDCFVLFSRNAIIGGKTQTAITKIDSDLNIIFTFIRASVDVNYSYPIGVLDGFYHYSINGSNSGQYGYFDMSLGAAYLPINYKYEYIDLTVGDTAYQYEINPFNHSLEFIENRNLYFMNYKTLQDVSDNYLLALSCKRR